MEQLGSLWTDLYEIWYSSIFRKFVEIIQVSFNLSRKTGTLHEDQFTLYIYLAEFFLEWEKFQSSSGNQDIYSNVQ